MNILIIDDNIHHAELAAIRLRELNWSVSITNQTQIPEDLDRYDIVVTDYSMPEKNGLAIMREVWQVEPDMPIILVTGYGSEQLAIEAIKMGAYDYIVKDTQLDYLKKLPIAIEEAKKKYQLIQTNRMLVDELKRANEKLSKMTMTDEITGVHNYRFLAHELEKEIQRARRYSKPLSIAIIDIDHFKKINDQYGHPFGNFVLKTLATLLESHIRNVDFVTRFGGDEFVVVFPDTPLEAARSLCERIRKRIESTVFERDSNKAQVTISIGVTAFRSESDTNHQSLVSRADQCLYGAKRAGRNLVIEKAEELAAREADADIRPLAKKHAKDQRRSQRFSLGNLPLYWKIGASKYQESTVQNISDSGICFTSSKSLSISSIVNLKLEIPNQKKPITGISEVVHVEKKEGKKREYNVGIRFLNMHEHDQHCLRSYLDRVTPP